MNKHHSTVMFVSYAVVVAILSLQPGDGSSIGPYDKVAHFLTYGIFAVLALRLNLSARQYMYVCIGIVAYSGMLEVAQSFVPGREMSVLDLLANASGVVLVALFSSAVFSNSEERGEGPDIS